MRQVGRIEYELTLLNDLAGLTIVNHGRGEHADTAMPMILVVPREETLRMGAAVLDRAKAIRKIGPVLEGPELAFREWIVIGNIRSAVSLGDAQIRQQKRDRLGCHRRSSRRRSG